ncbi:MAG: phosphatidylserine/phosphatidylglycerophosphate/cardiolipin synthase family protein [Proteobacteria bacterium]|nr:phosphatidylserine/phosphatidylglycerophosphate/cardiolipin synthase family protein [Pseudomonadota bacterium]MCP4915752.1 phosphatidylserine/phosphatidylglycerophosphate/cardiolipin synthase family protein [Pseudomonadota bacterium]
MRRAFLAAEGGPVSRASGIALLGTERSLFRSLDNVVDSARTRLDMRFYRIADDAVGQAFAERLVSRVQDGVGVRVLLDGFGSAGAGPIVEMMRAGGVQVRWFNPPLDADVDEASMRDHAKLVVADRERAWVSSANIGEGYSIDWHDCGLDVAGPVVRWLDEEFVLAWQAVGLHSLPTRRNVVHVEAPPPGPTWCRVVSNGFRGWDVRPHVEAMLRAAQRTIHVHHCYLTDNAVLELLRERARDGLRVLVLAPHASDVPAVDLVMQRDVDGLVEAGIEYRHWPEMSHRKYLSVDHRWMLFGSSNLDGLSLDTNLEVNVAVFSRRLGRTASARLVARDVPRSHLVLGSELTLPGRLASELLSVFRAVL